MKRSKRNHSKLNRSKRNRSKRNRSKRNKTRKYQRGGVGTCGSVFTDRTTLGRFANYWYNKMNKDTWWSQGQDGYYFSNRTNGIECHQSQSHTHIYRIDDLDTNPNGMKKINWATKKDNVQQAKGSDNMNYNDIASWLITKNDSVSV